MSAIEGVSEIFDPEQWDDVPGFDDLTDLTYHRARAHGTVRVAFDRPDILNAFRPHTVDELLRVLEHARTSSDVGCVLLTGNGPSAKNGKWAFCTGGDQRIRGKAGYQYETAGHDDEGAPPNPIDAAKLARLHILECQRLIRFMPKIVISVVNGWANHVCDRLGFWRGLEKLIEMTTGAVPRTHDHVCFALFERDRLFLTKSTWDYSGLPDARAT